ncbi:hypothetical protein LCGC14_1781340, partial [marine sediment metagenome]
ELMVCGLSHIDRRKVVSRLAAMVAACGLAVDEPIGSGRGILHGPTQPRSV